MKAIIGILAALLAVGAVSAAPNLCNQCIQTNWCINNCLTDNAENTIQNVCGGGDTYLTLAGGGGGLSMYDVWYGLTGNGSNKFDYDTYDQYVAEQYQAQIDALVEENLVLQKRIDWLYREVYQLSGHTPNPWEWN